MKEYWVQRPSTVWMETRVEANSFEEALELADHRFRDGLYESLDDTFEVDYDRHWIQDEDENIEEEY